MQNLICVKAGLQKSWFVQKASACKTAEIEQKGVKCVDASGLPVRVHAEKAVSAEDKQR